MSSAHVLPLALDRALRNGFFNVADVAASGTFSWSNKERVVIIVNTVGAELRNLPTANAYAVGTSVLVNLRVAGGALTIDYGSPTVVLSTAGDAALFVCTAVSTTVNKWTLVALSGGDVNLATVVTRATAAAATGKVPVSGGADRTITAATPVALGTVDINTGDAATDAAIIALVNALTAFGLTTATWT